LSEILVNFKVIAFKSSRTPIAVNALCLALNIVAMDAVFC
jgi:hypothetical protein